MRSRPILIRQSADDSETDLAIRNLMRQVADDDPSRHEPDERSPEERQRQALDFRRAYAASERTFNPTPEQVHLDTIAFIAGVLGYMPRPFPITSEDKQYVALLHARQLFLGRPLRLDEYEALRFASRRVWAARQMVATAFAPQVPAA